MFAVSKNTKALANTYSTDLSEESRKLILRRAVAVSIVTVIFIIGWLVKISMPGTTTQVYLENGTSHVVTL